jgi:hypothetical protein
MYVNNKCVTVKTRIHFFFLNKFESASFKTVNIDGGGSPVLIDERKRTENGLRSNSRSSAIESNTHDGSDLYTTLRVVRQLLNVAVSAATRADSDSCRSQTVIEIACRGNAWNKFVLYIRHVVCHGESVHLTRFISIHPMGSPTVRFYCLDYRFFLFLSVFRSHYCPIQRVSAAVSRTRLRYSSRVVTFIRVRDA